MGCFPKHGLRPGGVPPRACLGCGGNITVAPHSRRVDARSPPDLPNLEPQPSLCGRVPGSKAGGGEPRRALPACLPSPARARAWAGACAPPGRLHCARARRPRVGPGSGARGAEAAGGRGRTRSRSCAAQRGAAGGLAAGYLRPVRSGEARLSASSPRPCVPRRPPGEDRRRQVGREGAGAPGRAGGGAGARGPVGGSGRAARRRWEPRGCLQWTPESPASGGLRGARAGLERPTGGDPSFWFPFLTAGLTSG